VTAADDVTDEEIGAYWDVHQAEWWVGVPDDEKASRRAKYIREVRANPEALRQLVEERRVVAGDEVSSRRDTNRGDRRA
jgi:hypothetical protein